MASKPQQDEFARKIAAEVKVRFDREELEGFFDGFAPLLSPLDELIDDLLHSGEPAQLGG